VQDSSPIDAGIVGRDQEARFVIDFERTGDARLLEGIAAVQQQDITFTETRDVAVAGKFDDPFRRHRNDLHPFNGVSLGYALGDRLRPGLHDLLALTVGFVEHQTTQAAQEIGG
jgi:hypothetical protein